MSALRKWLDAERGRGANLAKELEITQGAISQWADTQVPAERLFVVSRLTEIPIKKLRPDLVEGNT
jgi:DNA-binding transcriptional regulator YdaS (Cro superfamily)